MAIVENFSIPSLKSLYSKEYGSAQDEWRRLGAIAKAQNIFALLSKSSVSGIDSVLEVGAGTGHVLEQLSRRGIGRKFVGLEITETRTEEAHQRFDDEKIKLHGYDGRNIPYADNSFDFVYATHVLEHVPDERGFLGELRRVARRQVYVEVPCELNVGTSHGALQSTLNIGHINAYTPESFALKLETSGLKILCAELFDIGFSIHAFGGSRIKAALKSAIKLSALRVNVSLASKLFTYHCGALCERAAELDI